MNRFTISNLRRSRYLRYATSLAIAGHVCAATPVLAQDLTQATVKASGQLVRDVSTVMNDAAVKGARKTRRLASDARRKLTKASIRVNRTVPKTTPAPMALTFGVHVTLDMIKSARVFEEPLIPVGESSADDNRAIGQLLQAVAPLPRDQQATRIERYLQDHPASPWRPSLLAAAATLYAKEGYYTRAASYWQQAFWLTRDNPEPGPRAIADHSLGEWLTQMTMFGQVERMEAVFAEIAGRDVRGSAGAKVSVAAEGLKTLRDHHEMATFSGPEALKAYFAVKPTASLADSIRTVAAYHPPMSGTTLADLQGLARSAGAALEMMHLVPIGDIPVPSIVHFRSQHYSAIVGRDGDKYVLRDPGLGGVLKLTGAAIRDESTGYFLVPAATREDLGGRLVSEAEAVSVLGHCAPGGPAGNDPPCPACGGGGPGPSGMPSYSFHPQKVSLLIDDVPVGYTPPLGPPINFHLTYDHRETRNPQMPTFGQLGPMWSHNWLSYVKEGPPPSVVLRGIGQEQHTAFVYQIFSGASLLEISQNPIRYERHLPDGSVEVFTVADRPAGQPNRKVFLSEVIDPQGHSVTLTYDSSVRLVAITDAIGQVTTLAYEDAADPLRITKVTDPFGRAAMMSYDAFGRLATITDAAGMSSSFTYGASDFIQAMTTPYGTTTFRPEPLFADRRIEATDPAGGTERLEYRVNSAALSATVPATEVPAGFSGQNVNLQQYNVFYWDKSAMAAGPTVANATITALMLASTDFGGHVLARNVPHSIKKPLESRVWYTYANSVNRGMSGHAASPTAIGRIVEGGASQVTQMTYNSKHQLTSRIDPAGRQTNYTYATNDLDLLTVEQVRSGGTDVVQSYGTYTARHLPGTITDAAGQDTDITYNAFGQPLTVTNAKNETTTYTYDTNGYLQTVTGPVSGATTSYTYDAYGRVESVEDADGYIVISDYDHLNRLTQRTYPDDTTETNVYSRLDLLEQHDRLGRVTRHFYDGYGRRIATRDPAGRTISQVWCDCGALDALIDGSGNRTRWERDVQGRVTREIRADNTTDTLYTYDLSGRLKTITDPKDQVTTHSYNIDDSLSGTGYTNEAIATPDVSYTYDPYYSRIATMVDGIGTTAYTYTAPGTNGAGQVATVDGPLTNDTIAYTYDELGRVVQRTINGSANQVDWTFDALGRVASEENLLGEFTYTYHGVTNRLSTVTYPNGQTSTYSYFDDEHDHRLQTIHHQYPNTSTLSKFDYTYDVVGNILTWRQQADSTAVLWRYGYDPTDQLTAAVKHATDPQETILKRYAYAYDPAGNRTVEQIDDAVTLSAYDNLNRLTSQAPGGPMVVAGSLNEPGTVTISGVPAIVDANNNFRGTVPTTTGTNTFTIVARDASGNTTTQQYEIGVSGATKTFIYDANGNLTADGTRTFDWDARNHMAAVETSTVRTEFLYDGYRRRSLEITTDGSNTSERVAVWCGTVECEQRDLTTATRFYSRGEHSGGAARLLVADHLGSTASVTDSTGASLTSFTYDPWGRTSVTSGTPWDQKGFTGRRGTAAAGTWAMVYRDYDPSLGRWLSEDPIGFEGGINLYSYVEAGPTTGVDPSGLITVNVQPVKINYTPRARVPGGACGATNQIRSFNGQCQCTPSGYRPTLEVSYKPEMWIAVDANIPPDIIQQHEWRHYQDGLSAIQEAVADGAALEQKTFGSNGTCLAAIDRWALKSSRRFTTSSMWFHFWERTKFWRTTCSRQ